MYHVAFIRSSPPSLNRITLTDRLPPPVSRRKHLVSCLVFAAYRFDYAPLSPLPPGKSRILAALRQVKDHYDGWLANPCLPHFIAELCPYIAPTKENVAAMTPPLGGPHAPMMTNVGRVEDYVAPLLPTAADGGDGEEAVIRVEDMHLACRMGSVWLQP